MKKICTFLLLLSLFLAVFIQSTLAVPPPTNVTVSGAHASSNGDYATLKLAFDAINAQTQTGYNIVVAINATTTETASAVLNSGAWSSLTIYPTSTGLSISGDLTAPLIDLNGADNVTIDGRVNQSGNKDLIITNTNTTNTAGTSTIRFIDDASNNTVKYCTIKGSSSGQSIINFMGTTGSTGNNDNIIEYNDITNANNDNRPGGGIYSAGTAGKENSGNIIRNNNFFDLMSNTATIITVHLAVNTTGWTISGNSFYEQASFTPSNSNYYVAIRVNNTSGNGFVITNNYIGGTAPNCGGDAWTKTNANDNTFYGIRVNVGTSTASSVQGNAIKNINWSNSTYADWYGFYIQGGSVNIGNTTGNTIGETTSPITVTNGTDGGSFYGMNLSSTGTITVSNNNIGSINANPAYLYGIYNFGTGSKTISGNTIDYLYNACTETSGQIIGIKTYAGSNTISDNTIRDLSIANSNTGGGSTASIIGICQSSTTAGQSISGNTIYNLSNTNSGSNAVNNIGLYYTGATTGTNSIAKNFIHSLTLASSSTSASIYGIDIEGGTATYSNNIISLGSGVTTGYAIYGIKLLSEGTNTLNLYYNTVDIEGTVTGVTSNTYSLSNGNGGSNFRNYRNNIFNNSRSGGSTGKHYAISVAVVTNLTIDYDDYYAPNGVLGSLTGVDKTTLADWRTATSGDAHSLNINPSFALAGGTSTANYLPSETSLIAVTGTGITTDYSGTTRSVTYPAMGAIEYTVEPPVSNPILSTTAPSSITSTTASGGGNITDIGSSTVTTRGICWALTSGVTTANTKTTESGTFGTGSFTASYTGLTPNTLYYTAAYGTNTAGTGYGNELSFTTLPDLPTNLSSSNKTCAGFRFSWSAPSPVGNQTYTYNVQISTSSAFTSPVVNLSSVVSTTLYNDASGLNSGTLYYCRVSATNTAGTGTWAETTITTYSNFTSGTIANTGETICYNGDPGVIGSTTAASGGDGTITYQWQSSTVAAFTSPSTISSSNSATYDPPTGLTVSTWYRRQAKDGTCNNTFTSSTNTWKVTVRDNFTAGTITNTGETICYNGDPSEIQGIDNGTIVSSPGTGYEGKDQSYIRTSGNTIGFGFAQAANNTVEDDFVVLSNITINSVVFQGYQTGSTITSTFTGLYFRIYDGEPGAGGSVVWGDLSTNRMTSTSFSTIYRAFPSGNATRPVMNITCSNLNVNLAPGTYWIEWQATGSLASGPFVPPTVSLTGNAKQYSYTSSTYTVLSDAASGIELPFFINGMGATGGNGTISYQWQKSTTSDIAGFNDISGATSYKYDPPANLTETTWYRRQAKDGTCNTNFTPSTGVWKVTVDALPVPIITGSASVNEASTGNVYSTESGMTGYTWSVSSGGTITAGGETSDNTVTITWNTPGPQTVSVNYINSNNCTAVSATVKNINVIPSTVYLCAGYDATHTPDNNYWNILYFNDLASAITNSTTNSTIIVKSYNGTTNTTVSTINTDNNTFEIDNGDFTVTTINGSGLIKAISTGYLILSPTQNVATIYPLTDGTNDLSISITCLNAPTNPVQISIHHDKTGVSMIMSDFWNIIGDNNLNATLMFNISKTAVSGEFGLIRYWNGTRYVPVPQERTTIEDKGTYYQVSITGINQFNWDN